MQAAKELTEADAEAFREIRLEALRLHPEAFGSAFEVEANESIAKFRQAAARGGIFGGFVNNQMMGMAGFHVYGAARLRHKATLGAIDVRESQRGTGLAEAIPTMPKSAPS
jgi:hypothetical protein